MNQMNKRLHQLRLQIDPDYSREKKICTWSLDGECGLTFYGQERARVCEGGHPGCEGEVEMVTIDTGEYSYEAPRCKNCQPKGK